MNKKFGVSKNMAFSIISPLLFGLSLSCVPSLIPILSLPPICSEGAETMYYFSSLALTLNEPEEGVAPTDSRRRPDQQLMEAGRWDEANAEKQRLEEKQRSVRREREREAQRAANLPEEGAEGVEVAEDGEKEGGARGGGARRATSQFISFLPKCSLVDFPVLI